MKRLILAVALAFVLVGVAAAVTITTEHYGQLVASGTDDITYQMKNNMKRWHHITVYAVSADLTLDTDDGGSIPVAAGTVFSERMNVRQVVVNRTNATSFYFAAVRQ